jgi:hypothetical protein
MGIQDDIVQLSAGCVSSAALTGKVLFHTRTQCVELFPKCHVTEMKFILLICNYVVCYTHICSSSFLGAVFQNCKN